MASNFFKNKSAMRTCGLMLSFIPFGWNVVFKCQYLGVATSEKVDKPLQFLSGKCMAEYCLLTYFTPNNNYLLSS